MGACSTALISFRALTLKQSWAVWGQGQRGARVGSVHLTCVFVCVCFVPFIVRVHLTWWWLYMVGASFRILYTDYCIHGPVEDFAEAFPARAVRRPHVSVRYTYVW